MSKHRSEASRLDCEKQEKWDKNKAHTIFICVEGIHGEMLCA